MKKLEDYKGQKIAIHFPTYELWLRRKEINPSDKVLDEVWNRYKENTCYFIDLSKNGDYDSLNYAKTNGYTILPATDFLEDEFIYGQEYEFSDYPLFDKRVVIGKFMAKSSNGSLIAELSEDDSFIEPFKYARKINTERTEAVATAKELIVKHNIKQEELFNQ